MFLSASVSSTLMVGGTSQTQQGLDAQQVLELYSFHYSQVSGFERIYELARQHSYVPAGFDELSFANLPAEDPMSVKRQTLNHLPDEAVILQQEYELSQHNGDYSVATPLRDVESPRNRRVLEALKSHQPGESQPHDGELPRRQLKHREASGYVKLDERRTRMADLIAEVRQFFGTACRCQGDYWCPRGGFRDWHTNKYDASGWRLLTTEREMVFRRSWKKRSCEPGS